MTLVIVSFLAGWFACVLGFEIAPIWGNLTGIMAIVLLISYAESKKRII